MSVFLVKPGKLIHSVAEKLKEFESIQPPEGSQFWKTAHFREKAPEDSENFWWIRCASILRKIKKYGPLGVNRLRKHYGGKDSTKRGLKHSKKASGKIIRLALQQLEDANLLQSTKKRGRKLTPEGTSFLERTAYSILREKK